MTDPTNNSDDLLKKPGRRNWLRNAAIAATSALVLIFTGCTKEQWDNVKGHVPGGGLGSTPDIWFNLKVTYKDKDGNTSEGFMGRIANISTRLSIPTPQYWDYMKIGGKSKFKRYPGRDGFELWQTSDGLWLTLSYYGWAYRSSEGDRVGWKIVDGKLYSDYSRWKDYPLGCRWDGGEKYYDEFRGIYLRTPEAYYVGVDLGDDKVLTNCEFVLAAPDSDL